MLEIPFKFKPKLISTYNCQIDVAVKDHRIKWIFPIKVFLINFFLLILTNRPLLNTSPAIFLIHCRFDAVKNARETLHFNFPDISKRTVTRHMRSRSMLKEMPMIRILKTGVR